MSASADFVVAGAGHNSLITAAYLAQEGYSSIVLDARPIPGGGATTEEFLLPGLGIDACSTGHTLIRLNPLIRDDELGLVAKHGLSYVDPDPVAIVAFPDGEHFTMSLDRETTIAEFARYSAADAEAYRRLLEEWADVASIFGQSRFRPIGYSEPVEALLAKHPRADVWLKRQSMSAFDVIMSEFEDRHCQSFLLWMAFQTLVAIDRPGTGLLAYSLISGRQRNSWSIPLGGSGTLIDALVGYLTERDVSIACNKLVERLVIENGQCVGVETSDGDLYRGTKGVISTIHAKHLVKMAPAQSWGEEFRAGIERYEVGISGLVAYAGSTEAPVFDSALKSSVGSADAARGSADGAGTAVSAGIVAWPDRLAEMLHQIDNGLAFDDVPCLLVATPTLVDMSRSVDHLHTVKMLSAVTYELPPGKDWFRHKRVVAERYMDAVRQHCSNFTSDVIVKWDVRSPDDIEAHNRHMIRGTYHGGDRSPANSGVNRPARGWAQHRMPIPGLYQTGGSTHPGGSITGGPGRNAAIVILEDLDHDISAMLSAF